MADSGKTKKKWRAFIIAAGLGLAVLAALAAVLVNSYTSGNRRRAAATHEATTVQHLKNLAACQQIYLDAYGDYATFDQLVGAGVLLNEKFAGESPVVDGYVYRLRLTPRQGDRPPSYAINADPQPSEDSYTGEIHFYMDSNVVGIRQNDARPATATDRPRE